MQDEHDRVLESLIYDGIRINKLCLASFPETGRGLAATESIRKDEILLTIPPRHILNLKVVGKEFGFDWRKPPLPAHVALSLYILAHKADRESPLKHYIASLPTSFESIPLTWETELADKLPVSTKAYLNKQQKVYEKHLQLAENFVKSHERISSILGTTLNREDFLWSWLVVNSRCIYQSLSPTSTRDDNYACSPLVDMINHVPSSVSHCKLSYDIKGLSVISQSPYKSGKEVSISYGAHSNEALICEYGFTIPSNSDNTLIIDALFAEILKPWQTRLLMEMGYFEDCTIDDNGYPSFRTDVTLRTALLDEDQCVEGSDGCRRLTQYVNGRSSGRSEQAAVDRLLKDLLSVELRKIQDAISSLKRTERGNDPNMLLIRRIWRDQEDIVRIALDRLCR